LNGNHDKENTLGGAETALPGVLFLLAFSLAFCHQKSANKAFIFDFFTLIFERQKAKKPLIYKEKPPIPTD